jgi:putative membrane protein
MKTAPILYTAVLAAGLTACGSNRSTSAQNANPDQMAPGAADNSADRTAGSADRTAGGANLSAADRDFMTKAAQGGMAEVQMGQMAQEKGQSQAVKDYGKRLVDDHTAANNKLKQIAADEGATLPAEVDSKDKSEMDRLGKLSGARFDQEFMKHAVDDHKKDITEFQKEANNGTDPQVKTFASDTLPTLQQHLEGAQNWKSK